MLYLDTSAALKLIMPEAERARRAAALASAGAAFPPSAWLQAQLDALTG